LRQRAGRHTLGRDRRDKWIEVAHHQVDWRDVVLGELRLVRGQVAAGEDAAMQLGVQRFHAPVENLGEAGQIAHTGHRHTRLGKRRFGAAGGVELPAQLGQSPAELGQPRLIPDTQYRTHVKLPVVRG
jgi:hypothetical protein